MQAQMRQEQGLEDIEPPMILERVERLLGYTEDDVHTIFHNVEDELWEHAWYAYTDEWAWYRAQQDATQELGARAKTTSDDAREHLAEKYYNQRFDSYAEEIDMNTEKKREKKQKVKKTKT